MTHSPLQPFAATSGAKRPRMVLVGEAWGASEEQLRKPFVGESGKELFLILGQAMPHIAPELHAEIVSKFRYGLAWVGQRNEWLEEAGVAMTNVLAFRPPNNKLDPLCLTKKELPADYSRTYLAKGKYLDPQYLCELDRLAVELTSWQSNLVVAMGGTAIWALLNRTDIGKIRGTITSCPSGKLLPTYHPASVLYQWNWRPILVADLMKADSEASFSDIRRVSRQLIYSPTLEQVQQWTSETIRHPPKRLACDTETYGGQITDISFARSITNGIIVPFWNKYERDPAKRSYWPTVEEEFAAWDCVAKLLESPSIGKVGQNFVYDLQYLTRMGISPRNISDDTMLRHHSIFPEMQKGLGFLGSIYCNEPAWKLMRTEKADTEKRDE